MNLVSALLTVSQSTVQIIHLDSESFILVENGMLLISCHQKQEVEWKTSKQFDLKNSKKVKCALLQTSCKPVCLTKDFLLVMTPSDDGWNKMFSKGPQNGLNEDTLELAKTLVS